MGDVGEEGVLEVDGFDESSLDGVCVFLSPVLCLWSFSQGFPFFLAQSLHLGNKREQDQILTYSTTSDIWEQDSKSG